jgi:hypothetical protein
VKIDNGKNETNSERALMYENPKYNKGHECRPISNYAVLIINKYKTTIMSITIKVESFDVTEPLNYPSIPWSENMTIQGAMEACYNLYTLPGAVNPFTFLIQYYGTYNQQFIGYMPTAINSRQRSDQYIWFVYLNNVKTNNSLDAATLNPDDLIEFRYESYDEANESTDSIYKAMVLIERTGLKLKK